MSDVVRARVPWVYAVFLIVAGGIGWLSAFELTVDKFILLADPDANLNCNLSPLVQCGTNLNSPQGAVFGFPNPLIGLGGFAAVIAVGVGLLAGARFARWFWIAFNVGLVGALGFVIWLIGQSIYVLGTLCPWCMAVWSVTIPLFIATTLRNLAEGVYTDAKGPRRVARALLPYTFAIALLCYILIAVLAQLQLDVIGALF